MSKMNFIFTVSRTFHTITAAVSWIRTEIFHQRFVHLLLSLTWILDRSWNYSISYCTNEIFD